MKAVRIDFVPRPPVPRWVVVVVTASLGIALLQAWQATDHVRQRHALMISDAQQASGGDHAKELEAQRAASQPSPAYAREALLLAKAAGLDIGRVFAAVESAQTEGVRLRSLEVLAVEHRVQIEVEFAAAGQLNEHLGALNVGLPDADRWQVQRVVAPTGERLGQAILLAAKSFGVR